MDITINGGGETGKRLFNSLVMAVVAQVHEVQTLADVSSWPGVAVIEVPNMPSVSIYETNNSLTMLDITLSGPQGSGKTKLAAQIWAWLDGKRSLVQVHALKVDSCEDAKTVRTWHAVNADVIIFDGCLGDTVDLARAHALMRLYRQEHNPGAVAIYVTDLTL